MKSSTTILLAITLFCLFTSFIPKEKQIEKVAKKVWKGKEFVTENLELDDSLSLTVPMLSSVKINQEVVGYVCFSTSFGCRIGGCSSANAPNAQSYETFDYIVVYDKDINILRVEVVNFGGEYGYEICRQKWLEQFEGMNSGFKLGDNIDGITGATVSASHLVDDLNFVGGVVLKLKLDHKI